IVSGNIISLNDQIGVHLYNLSNTIVSGNIISLNDKGMLLSYSSGNTISDNIISLNNRGIEIISYSSDNTISNNNISNNEYGVMLRRFSNNNNIFRNIISLNSGYGIYIFYPLYEPCNNNLFYHNNLIDNTQNAYDEGNNSWDNGYPSCGNFWSDYSDVDNFHGENQNLPGQDGVGDTPYLVPGGNNKDRYPLMEPYGMTKLEIYIGKYWYYRLPISIMNVGNNTAFNVQWSVTIDGGFILFGRESSNGISRPLLPGEEVTVSSGLILFGFGKIKIMLAAWADNAPMVSGTISGFLFLFFIKINPGG
ncbi:MAG: right-handed parallel beta-helix repeat-containing protein, partial [Thermoplasmatales archaeon]|nr:right-handed parallel beta-helix repeat-containing protein [Thermoplasmatales archaeon]